MAASSITRRLFGACNAVASNVVSILIVRDTYLLGVEFSIMGLAAAAVDGRGTVELSKTNVTSLTVNDTPNSICTCSWNAPIASAAIMQNKYIATGAIRLRAGDYVYMHTYYTGTALANGYASITLFLAE